MLAWLKRLLARPTLENEDKGTRVELRRSEEFFRHWFESAPYGACRVDTSGRFLQVNQSLCDMLGYSREELAQTSFHHVIRSENGTDQRYSRKNGQTGWATVSSGKRPRSGETEDVVILVQDITERKRAEAERTRLIDDLGERITNMTALHQTARLLQKEEPINEKLLSEFVELLPSAWQHPEVCEARIAYSGLMATTRNWRSSPWMQTAEFTSSGGGQGSIAIAYQQQRPPAADGLFLAEERELIQSLADLLQQNLERKETEDKLRATSEQLRALMASLRSAKEEEGLRIAREIHDELGSALTSLRWDLEDIDRSFNGRSGSASAAEIHAKISAMFGRIDSTIDVVRRISSELRPSILDDLGLAAAVEWQAQQFQSRTAIRCRYDCSVENLRFDAEQSTAVFRILQEALTNVLRHAQATEVHVSLEEDEADFILKVRDNGQGIGETEKTSHLSLGLLGMRERAHLLGGRIEITGALGKGTTVVLRIPSGIALNEVT